MNGSNLTPEIKKGIADNKGRIWEKRAKGHPERKWPEEPTSPEMQRRIITFIVMSLVWLLLVIFHRQLEIEIQTLKLAFLAFLAMTSVAYCGFWLGRSFLEPKIISDIISTPETLRQTSERRIIDETNNPIRFYHHRSRHIASPDPRRVGGRNIQ